VLFFLDAIILYSGNGEEGHKKEDKVLLKVFNFTPKGPKVIFARNWNN